MIGINTAIFSQSGGSVGIGFAIPANMVRGVIDAARHGGHITRPWLGASGQTVTPELARSLQLPLPEGVLIKDVAPGGPAAAAGLRDGDVVLSVGGHDVASPDELRFRIATLPIDARADLALWRNGGQRALIVALTAPPETPPRDITVLDGREPFGGATVANLNPAFDAELGLDDSATGVIVRRCRAAQHRRGNRHRSGRHRAGRQRPGDRQRRDAATGRRATAAPWHIAIRATASACPSPSAAEHEPVRAGGAAPARRQAAADRGSPTSSGRIICSVPTGPIGRMAAAHRLASMILWGPPGCGKTTIARLLAQATDDAFRAAVGGVLRRRRSAQDVRRRAQAAPGGPGHAAVRRRDPPLQPRAAGRLPALCRGRHGDAGRRHHGKPVLRAERRAAVALPGIRAEAARGRRARNSVGASRGGARPQAAARRPKRARR